MHPLLSRRHFLAATAALGVSSGLGLAQSAAATSSPLQLIIGRRTIDVNGKPASVFGIRQANGTPGLILDPGQRFNVAAENQAGEQTIVHWHGQTPPADQDGVVDTGYVSLIPAGGRQTYDYAPRSGTHWMHSHHGLQEQLLMAAPLIVHAGDDLHADAQEVIALLHDFTFRDPAEVLAGLGGGAMAMSSASSSMHGMPGMNMGGGSMPMSGGTTADINDVDYDAYLANDRTLADPQVIRVERGGRVRLRLINAATSTAFWIDLGALDGTIVAVDGDPVQPVPARRFPVAEAQRLDIMLQLPAGSFPVLAQREGDRQRTGIILATQGATVSRLADLADAAAPPADLSFERRLAAVDPLKPRKADVTHRVTLTGTMQRYVWSINGQTWARHQPLRVKQGQRVALEFINNTPMAHPMHLHGHHFQVVGIDSHALRGAMRDTVLVPAEATVRVAFDADNPGRWLLHCHNLFHMATGMMTEIAYET